MENALLALGLTILAGLATGIGSIIAFVAKRTEYRFLSISTGFSAGVMLYVSFVEIFHKGLENLVNFYGDFWGQWINVASFFGGIFIIGLIDNIIPSSENPHETHSDEERALLLKNNISNGGDFPSDDKKFNQHLCGKSPFHTIHDTKLMRMGLFTALAIGIHNFPEGLATFFAALNDTNLGIAIAIAVALHNIPEGISVSVPIFYATGNRTKAFVYSFLSGLAEPFGAFIAYLLIKFFAGDESGIIQPHIMGIVFGMVSGIMVYISLDELLPTSRAYGKGHDSILGLVAGMLLMAISLLLMKS